MLVFSKSPGYHRQGCFLALTGRDSPVNVKTKEKICSPRFLSPIFVFWVIMRRRSETNNAAVTFQPPVLGCPLSCGSLPTLHPPPHPTPTSPMPVPKGSLPGLSKTIAGPRAPGATGLSRELEGFAGAGPREQE